MGKTPKKAAPGGDERNLYNWRLKATTAPSNSSETSLPKRQRETEIPNRSKLTTLQKKIPLGQKKNFKSVSKKFEANQSKKQQSKPSGIPKEKKTSIPDKSVESKILETMQPESEEAEVKLNSAGQEENQKKQVSTYNQESAKECVDHASSKEPEELASKEQKGSTSKEITIEKEKAECSKINNSEKSKEDEDAEESDLKLSLDIEDNSVQTPEDKSSDKECSSSSKNDATDKEEPQDESQADTESCSVDILESTTSEVSEVSETPSQSDAPKEKEKVEKDTTKEASFVSYDSSIMLKDVQIKLNDCLKENSKLFDTSSTEQHSTHSQPSTESFGKTLRSISGRRSLNRMRYVTLREHRYSPNDSLFVNTSTASVAPDDTADYKILRYSTGLSDVLSTTNGSPTERKRKHDTEDWNSMKKQRTEAEQQGLLHSSIDLLKGLRRPIQVSTPVSELKFQSGKLNLGDEQETKQSNEGIKKWCAIM